MGPYEQVEGAMGPATSMIWEGAHSQVVRLAPVLAWLVWMRAYRTAFCNELGFWVKIGQPSFFMDADCHATTALYLVDVKLFVCHINFLQSSNPKKMKKKTE